MSTCTSTHCTNPSDLPAASAMTKDSIRFAKRPVCSLPAQPLYPSPPTCTVPYTVQLLVGYCSANLIAPCSDLSQTRVAQWKWPRHKDTSSDMQYYVPSVLTILGATIRHATQEQSPLKTCLRIIEAKGNLIHQIAGAMTLSSVTSK